MQREATPLLMSAQIPARHQGVCTAAQNLRNHIVMLAGHVDLKCLSQEQYTNLTASLNASMRDANSNIGLFCP